MGNPQDYGIFHFLDYSLFDDTSFAVEKLHQRTLSHLFSRVDDIRRHKDKGFLFLCPRVLSCT
jgi:hypothetical protein